MNIKNLVSSTIACSLFFTFTSDAAPINSQAASIPMVSTVAIPVVKSGNHSRTNIIFLIGDGMGPAYTSAYRYFSDNLETHVVERTIFDRLLTGMSSTYSDKLNEVTDSAAAATALTTGKKTYRGAIGMGPDHKPLDTIFERAKKIGYLTGVAVTCQVNHATPAAFFSHQEDRENYNDIADQYLDQRINNRPKFDVLFGGGQDFFIRKDRNLINEFQTLGYSYSDNLNKLDSIQKLPAIGLFAPVGMTAAVDSEYPNRLALMTGKALALLNGKSAGNKPFFLMLEASQIDWCGHANDIVCAMGEVSDMAETMKLIKQFIDKNPNTIFVATADHSTGGLSMGAQGVYQWNPQVIKKILATPPELARKLIAKKLNWLDEWSLLTSIELDKTEQLALGTIIENVEDNLSKGQLSKENTNLLVFTIKKIIDKYSFTGWTSSGHTGEDVQVFSYGKGSEQFRGSMDNTDIAIKLFGYLK